MTRPVIELGKLEALLGELGQRLREWRDDHAARAVSDPKLFKTEVDRRAHEVLIEGLARIAPGVPVVSEEDNHFDEGQLSRRSEHWLIDPLDGTASWYGGYAGFVTQVALMSGGQPVVGVVHAPMLVKTWTATRGGGATLNGAPMRRAEVQGPPVFVDNTPQPHGITAKIMHAMSTTRYLESGSLGLKSVLVADGSADVFLKDVIVRDWDLAPAALIVEEVGGTLLRLDGSHYNFVGPFEKQGGFVVASSCSLAEDVVRAIRATSAEKSSGVRS
jgi:3'(2'), 5'-bisphosphate nucleotidase